MSNKCEHCGSMLDPGERCDCRQQTADQAEETALQCIAPPVIRENSISIASYVTNVLSRLSSLPKDKQGCLDAKALRADLRRRLDEFEKQRKAVKKAVLEPYTTAEQIYKEKIAAPLSDADRQLKDWIDGYQDTVKEACRKELQDYFDELCWFWKIDFVTFEQCGVVVDMATAQLKDPKKARQQIHDFLQRVLEDQNTIKSMEYAEEIMAEFRSSLSLSASIAAVNQRHEQIQRAKDNLETLHEAESGTVEARQRLHAAAPEIITPEERYTTSFSVTDTIPRLKALKAWLVQNQYTYEEE